MPNGITFEEEILNRLNEAKANQKIAEEVVRKAQSDIGYWFKYAKALEETLQLLRIKRVDSANGYQLNAERMRKQSTWMNLLEITSTNDGVLVVVDATGILVETGVTNEREYARNLIYSTLYSHKKDVEKIREGVYRLYKHGNPKKSTTKNKAKKQQKQRVVSGVRGAVKQLKDDNPQMTRKQVLDCLLTAGFDFKEKNPSGSVNMAWVYWGFSKENKQQSLLEIK